MKRPVVRYTPLHFIAFLTLLATACSSTPKWNNLDFYAVQQQEMLNEKDTVKHGDEDFKPLHDEGNREMDVSVDMHFIQSDLVTNKTICDRINAQLIERLLKQSGSLSPEEAVKQYIAATKAEFREDPVVKTYYDHLTGRAEYGFEDIINYRLEEEVFTGGAHPCTLTTILRFNAATGDFISLENVFPLEKQEALQAMLLSKLMADNGVTTVEALHEKGFLDLMDLFVSSNFALREDSIEFYYNVYDIAPYAYGPTTICLSYEQTDSLMNVTAEDRR